MTAVLVKHRSRRSLVLLVTALTLVACSAFYTVFGGHSSGPTFPHAPHIQEGMECATCHPTADKAPEPGMPPATRPCMLCHTEKDQGKPFERTVPAFVVDGKPRWLSRGYAGAGDVRFDHGKHAAANVACETCHAPQVTGAGESLTIAGGKSTCLACHSKTPGGTDCAVCHTTLRQDRKPPSHDGNWLRFHGEASHARIEGTGQTTCMQCHQEASCRSCHQEQAPLSHTNFWRRRGHGLTAAIDRTSCTSCHTPDYCQRCHQETTPASHRAGFGPPRNNHCGGACHTPPTGLGCGACHAEFPAHPAGPTPPTSAAHARARTAAECLACHVGLPHPNPGGECRSCHR